MGFSIAWCAVPEANADALIQRLNLIPDGETEQFPESLVSTAKLDTGWRVLWYNQYDCPYFHTRDLAELSENFELVVCRIEEHVMASSSELWSAGKRLWWISHDGEDGPKGLTCDGSLPEYFPAIRYEMEQAQLAEGGDEADVDFIFEIPLKVAQTMTGFKHDENCSNLVDGQFSVLANARPKGFLARLLGR